MVNSPWYFFLPTRKTTTNVAEGISKLCLVEYAHKIISRNDVLVNIDRNEIVFFSPLGYTSTVMEWDGGLTFRSSLWSWKVNTMHCYNGPSVKESPSDSLILIIKMNPYKNPSYLVGVWSGIYCYCIKMNIIVRKGTNIVELSTISSLWADEWWNFFPKNISLIVTNWLICMNSIDHGAPETKTKQYYPIHI